MVWENIGLLILALVHFPVRSLRWKHEGLVAGVGFCGLADLGRNVARDARPSALPGHA